MKSYRTVRAPASDEFVLQKSRFIGSVSPAETEEEAIAFLRDIRQRFRDASHHCYAYVIGENAGIMRYSDDGEPGGTAGLPMMAVLKTRQVVNLCVVATRYFGGVLLGAGGLVRAYTQACSAALNSARIVTTEPSARYLCEVAYPLWDKVKHRIKSLPVQLLSAEFTTAVTFTLLVRAKDAETVLETLLRLTDGRLEALKEEELFCPWDAEEHLQEDDS